LWYLYSMIMSNIAALIIHRRPKSRFAHGPPNRSQCTEFPTSCPIWKIVRWQVAVISAYRRHSSTPNAAVQTAFAGDAFRRLDAGTGKDRFTVYSGWLDANGFSRAVELPDRNGRGQLCQSKVPLCAFKSIRKYVGIYSPPPPVEFYWHPYMRPHLIINMHIYVES